MNICMVCQILSRILHGDSEFSIGNFAWGFRILYREFCMGIPNSLYGILNGDSEFSREFCMGMPNSLFVGGYQKH